MNGKNNPAKRYQLLEDRLQKTNSNRNLMDLPQELQKVGMGKTNSL